MNVSETPDDQPAEAALPEPKFGDFRSGFVAIVGKPNAGKSTLMNAIIGQKVAITSDKPQTTRDKISGIFTTTRFQMVFLDTPGVMVPEDRFNESLVSRAAEALNGVDVIYHLVDVTDREPPNARLIDVLKKASRKTSRKLLVLNKIDKRNVGMGSGIRPKLNPGIDPSAYDDVILISAIKKQGLDLLIEQTYKFLPAGPHYYDAEQITDRDMRFVASEIVREKVFRRTGAEIPYSVFTETDEFTERANNDFIRVTITVERDSQKGIIIGDGGRTLKDIGSDARRDIEAITDRPCFLELWVKVRKDWRRKEYDLNNFGFKLPRARPKGR